MIQSLLIKLNQLAWIGFFSWPLPSLAFDQNQIDQHIQAFQQQTLAFPSKEQCNSCTDETLQINDHSASLMVFASFSMPDSLWLSLNQEVERVGGAFILQGLPSNSFKELAAKLNDLRQKGVNATIQLHPQLFQEYGITQVPTFILKEEDGQWHKLAGSVSIDFVLHQFMQKGQSLLAPLLLKKLKEAEK